MSLSVAIAMSVAYGLWNTVWQPALVLTSPLSSAVQYFTAHSVSVLFPSSWQL